MLPRIFAINCCQSEFGHKFGMFDATGTASVGVVVKRPITSSEGGEIGGGISARTRFMTAHVFTHLTD